MELKLDPAYQILEKTGGGEAARARRKRLLEILYHERYITRKGLVWRLERTLGAECSWWDKSWLAFNLDMLFVKKAFKASGYKLAYSWARERRRFYLKGEGELSPEMGRAIQGAVDKVDPRQVEITRRLTPAQRVQQGCSITDLAHSVVRYRQDKNMGA